MKVSIVTPSYNQAEFLERTIRSVVDQDYPDKEYIIIDGGSSDQSVSIIRKYEDRITSWVSEKDEGQSHAINKGFSKTTGDIICWLNSDDVFVPGVLSRVVEMFQKNPSVDCIYGATYTIDQHDQIRFARHELPFDFNIMLFTMNYIPQSSTFWRRSVYEKVGPLRQDLHYTMDHEYWLRFYKHGITFMYVDDFFSYYRWHGESKGTINSGKIALEKSWLRRDYADLTPFRHTYRWLYPVLNIWYRFKRQAIKIFTYGRFEIIPQSWVRAYLKNVKGHFKNAG
ncbi:MAG: glycosyltransferase [Bacteroidetes bacterium]|nr:glycosyltransferase [Bacteroidota bacterium]